MLKNFLSRADTTLKVGIDKKTNWLIAIICFSAFGCSMVFNFVQDDLLVIDQGLQSLFVKVMSFLSFGFLYGTIISLLLVILIVLILRFLKIKQEYKRVIQFLVVAYKPYVLIATILTLRIVAAHFFENDLVQRNLFVIVALVFLLRVIAGILSIWILILIARGMKLLSGFNILKSLLIFLIASLLLSPINLILFF